MGFFNSKKKQKETETEIEIDYTYLYEAQRITKEIYTKLITYLKNNEIKKGDKYLFMFDEYLEEIEDKELREKTRTQLYYQIDYNDIMLDCGFDFTFLINKEGEMNDLPTYTIKNIVENKMYITNIIFDIEKKYDNPKGVIFNVKKIENDEIIIL